MRENFIALFLLIYAYLYADVLLSLIEVEFISFLVL